MPITVFEGNHLCGKPLDICPGIAAGTGETGGAASGSESKKTQGCWLIKWSKVEIQLENVAEDVGVVAAPMSGTGEDLVFLGNARTSKSNIIRTFPKMFGTTYKAVLESGTVIEVKRFKGVTTAHQRFKDTIEVVGAMDHENLLPLRAYCYSTDKKFLVYDYMPMGSLSELLHGGTHQKNTPPLSQNNFDSNSPYSGSDPFSISAVIATKYKQSNHNTV
ncbi:hypothetical protein Ancab_005920 [Ancistrocladus abbreviatus]